MNPQTIPFSPLSPGHRKRLEASGIGPRQVEGRGYRTVASGAELGRLGFGRDQRQTPALLIPIFGVGGKTTLHQIRPDRPRLGKGREIKYETPAGFKLRLDVPPGVRGQVLDPTKPLLVAEGVFKADAAATLGLACVASLGVDGWGGDAEAWDAIPLERRPVFVAFDSDVRDNRHVHRAAGRLASFLAKRGADVKFILLPEGPGGAKVGLDDYLAGGRDAEALFALAISELPPLPPTAEDPAPSECYQSTDEGVFRVTAGKGGEARIRLANFSAKIVAELVHPEDPERPREFEIDVRLNGKDTRITLPSQEFEKMNWVLPLIGAEAVIAPGFGVKDEVRAAIQLASGAAKRIDLYHRLGWTDLDGRGTWAFIHAGGIVAADSSAETESAPEDRGDDKVDADKALQKPDPIPPILAATSNVREIRVQLSTTLARYRLPPPPSGPDLVRAIRADLSFLDVAPDRITFPLYSGIFRIAVDVVRYSLFLYGTTGLGKSELSALVAQHFGPEMDAQHPAESFGSTPNALMATAHEAGNVVLVADDFVPIGSQGKIQRAHDDADRLFRSVANRVGRNRCRRDGSTQGGKEGNCLFLGNGEELPHGQSLGARLYGLEVRPGDVLDLQDPAKMGRLGEYQAMARAGVPAMVTAAFIRWLATDLDAARERLRSEHGEYRSLLSRGRVAHPRVVDMAADLMSGLDLYILFVLETGAITERERDELSDRAFAAFSASLDEQSQSQVEQDPGKRFLELLASALANGRAHLAPGMEGSEKDDLGPPGLWGYETRTEDVPRDPDRGGGSNSKAEVVDPAGAGSPERGRSGDESEGDEPERRTYLVPRGQQIGWRHCDNIYLDTELSIGVAQRLAWESGQPPLPHKKTIGKRLAALGTLVRSEKDRNEVRKAVDGVMRKVWHVNVFKFYEFSRSWASWEDDRDEEALREHEEFRRRQEGREAARELRRREARDFMQGRFARLLEPSESAPIDRPPSAPAQGGSADLTPPQGEEAGEPALPSRGDSSSENDQPGVREDRTVPQGDEP
jgi:hypothetical protein